MLLARNASYRLRARSCAIVACSLPPVGHAPGGASVNSATAAGLTYRTSSLNWLLTQTQSGQLTAMPVTVAGGMLTTGEVTEPRLVASANLLHLRNASGSLLKVTRDVVAAAANIDGVGSAWRGRDVLWHWGPQARHLRRSRANHYPQMSRNGCHTRKAMRQICSQSSSSLTMRHILARTRNLRIWREPAARSAIPLRK